MTNAELDVAVKRAGAVVSGSAPPEARFLVVMYCQSEGSGVHVAIAGNAPVPEARVVLEELLSVLRGEQ